MHALRGREAERRRLLPVLIFKALEKLPRGKELPNQSKGYKSTPRRPGQGSTSSLKPSKSYVPEVEIRSPLGMRERRLTWREGDENFVAEDGKPNPFSDIENRIENDDAQSIATTNPFSDAGHEIRNESESEIGRQESVVEQRSFSTQDQATFFTVLPKNVRLLIYEEVIGKQVLHVVRRRDVLSHAPCSHGNLKENMCRERRCRGKKLSNGSYVSNGDYAWGGPGYVGLLHMLQACRLLYSEAISILYSSNTFDFDSMETMISFSNSILPHRFDTIQSISFDLEFSTSQDYNEASSNNTPRWERTWMVVGSMKSLQELKVKIVWPRIIPSLQHELRLLDPLKMVTGLQVFEVQLPELTVEAKGKDVKEKYKHLGKVVGGDWEDEREEDMPFKIIRRKL